MPVIDKTEAIARLNDRARLGLDRHARIGMTPGLLGKLSDGTGVNDVIAQAATMAAMRKCTFAADSPERDFAVFEVNGTRAFMKIDYYDEALEYGSEDSADASVTRRVITIMAPEDY
ncbi:DUF3768 domain-containing protein [Novosphingobium sp. 9U]|uniref:DUF3768 domain-containing protein n=1 Tax=Novosphingobium sp. 9U TaxID=2653158 RepID=UPI0012F0D718|nr:DUF3768 domain-containing protein [Novosphingobium sp. 9U]VWX51054.1 conserved hypothetical protein [Novosphingobium sp. 9U]